MKMKAGTKPGITLIELLIVMPMLIIGSIILGLAVTRGWQAYLFASAQTKVSYESVNTLDRMSRVLRSTNKVVTAGPDEITVECYFSPRDSVPDLVRYFVENGMLMVETIPASGTAPNYTYDPQQKTTNPIAQLKNGSAEPLFSYFSADEQPLGATPDVAVIRTIAIQISLNPYPTILPRNQLNSTKVQLRNLKDNL
jgi:type II secretory pathway pseudopilin PulG